MQKNGETDRQTVWFLYTDTTLCLQEYKKEDLQFKKNKIMYFA